MKENTWSHIVIGLTKKNKLRFIVDGVEQSWKGRLVYFIRTKILRQRLVAVGGKG